MDDVYLGIIIVIAFVVGLEIGEMNKRGRWRK